MYVMCICIYNIKRVYVCIYTYLYTHTHAHISTQIPEKDFSVLSIERPSLLQNYIQHYYDFPSVISNFCYTYAGFYVMN